MRKLHQIEPCLINISLLQYTKNIYIQESGQRDFQGEPSHWITKEKKKMLLLVKSFDSSHSLCISLSNIPNTWSSLSLSASTTRSTHFLSLFSSLLHFSLRHKQQKQHNFTQGKKERGKENQQTLNLVLNLFKWREAKLQSLHQQQRRLIIERDYESSLGN